MRTQYRSNLMRSISLNVFTVAFNAVQQVELVMQLSVGGLKLIGRLHAINTNIQCSFINIAHVSTIGALVFVLLTTLVV